MKGFLHWLPRILVILYILFISLFALDVFAEYGFPEVLVALFMHLIPSFILIIMLILAWKKPKYGGISFMFLSLGFTLQFNTNRMFISFILLTCIPLLIGILFLAEGLRKNEKT